MRPRVVTAACATLAVASLVFLRLSAAPPLIEIDNPAPAANALFGTGVAGVGDLNGDGTPDLVAGAPGAGAAYVISGADRSVIRTLTNPENVAGVRFGYSVAGTGDLTGDGVDDIAVAAPGPEGFLPLPCDPQFGMVCPPPEWGRVFLFNGSTGALIRTLHPSAGEFFTFGLALASIGDVNGDGVPDLAVGSPVLLHSWGQVYAFSGADGSQLWMAQEPGDRQAIASFGVFLAPVADLNGDGRRDLVVSAPFFDIDPDPATYLLAGKVFVLSGATGGFLRSHLSPAPVDDGYYGGIVSGIGDQDGDGIEDYLMGDRAAVAIDLRSGATGALIRSIPGPADESDGGQFALARAGDRDGDAKEDFWAGAVVTGAAYLLNGTGTVLLQVSDPGPAVPGGNGFGSRLAATADLNGDARPDLLVAKPGQTVSGVIQAGAVYLITYNSPPHADAGPDQQVSAGADCLGTVTLNGAGSSDPDGDALSYTWTGSFGTVSGVSPQVSLPLGVHTVTLSVDDGHGGVEADTVTIIVVDTTPPAVTAISPEPDVLWPPNHRLVPVTVSVTATDNCGAVTCRIVSVSSSEPVNGLGDGDAAPDWTVTAALSVTLRAERAGPGSGRTYSIVVECTDAHGNSQTKTTTVTVRNDNLGL